MRKLIACLIGLSGIVVTLPNIPTKSAVAQQRSNLLSMTCLNSGSSSWRKKREDVPVGRRIYLSVLEMPGFSNSGRSGITCRIAPPGSPPQFKSLYLDFGVSDNERGSEIGKDQDDPSMVDVYVDGKKVASKVISKGQKKSISVNVRGARNVSIEVICPKVICVHVDFFELSLRK